MSTQTAAFSPRRALTALGRLLRDPDDLPQVFTLIQSISGRSPLRLLKRLRATERGARLLERRPDIVPLLSDREALRRLPAGSLGRAYLDFVESEGISAQGIMDAAARGRAAEELPADLEYLHARMRDTHDLWHAVTGYKGDVLGEAALLAFLLAQTRNPGVALIVLVALFKTRGDRDARQLIVDGFRRGRRAAWLPDVEWEALLAQPVADVRSQLGVAAPPVYTPVRSSELRN
jgi:ubiquinone biosynthesis protein COQ4